MTKKPINLNFSSKDFVSLKEGEELFKLALKKKIRGH